MSSCHPQGGTGCLAGLAKEDLFLLLLPAPSASSSHSLWAAGGEALGNHSWTGGRQTGGNVGLGGFNPVGRAVS